MILVDTNLLTYAHISGFTQHKAAHAWLDGKLNGSASVGMPWPSLLAFVRLVSNRRIFTRPVSVAGAWRQVEAWLDSPPVWIPQPTERHREVLGSLLEKQAGKANLVPRLSSGSPRHRARRRLPRRPHSLLPRR